MSSVLVLNAGYEPLHNVSVQHAIKMIVRKVAVIEEFDEDKQFGDFPFPKVLRLVKYIKILWRDKTPKYSKQKLFKRDNHQCAYCGKSANTVDHVIPRSRGGSTTWTNTVASCIKCNSKKSNKTLEQANMKLRFIPAEPRWANIL